MPLSYQEDWYQRAIQPGFERANEIKRLEMTHKARQSPYQQFQQEYPKLDQYGRDVASGRRFNQTINETSALMGKALESPEALSEAVGLFGIGGMTKAGKVLNRVDDVRVDSMMRDNVLEIGRIETPKKLRGKGLAEKKLKEILNKADKDGVYVALSPSSDFGASKSRLDKWYKKHGFVRNIGKNKNYSTTESMIREPK